MTRMSYDIQGLSLVVLDPKDGPNAIAFLTRAEKYLVAAEKLLPQKGFLPNVGDPESLLTGVALELLLKSFLLACGIPVEYLKNKIGHKLRQCLEEAERNGISKIAPISSVLKRDVHLLSDEYSGKHFEYFIHEGRAERPDLRQFLPEIRKVCQALERVYEDALKEERRHRTAGVPLNS